MRSIFCFLPPKQYFCYRLYKKTALGESLFQTQHQICVFSCDVFMGAVNFTGPIYSQNWIPNSGSLHLLTGSEKRLKAMTDSLSAPLGRFKTKKFNLTLVLIGEIMFNHRIGCWKKEYKQDSVFMR